MERAPSRAKASNILRPASRAQGAADSQPLSSAFMGANALQAPNCTPNYTPNYTSNYTPGSATPQQQPRVLPGGARLLGPGLAGMPGMQPNAYQLPLAPPGLLRRPPSSA
ncbi:hypothetical protein LPJ66_012006, partial [Kickxella alabastrina]